MTRGIASSKSFWNEKAKENAMWYISTYGPYEGRDEAGFWSSGTRIWDDLKKAAGYGPRKQDTVVEIGCGIGRITRAISADVGFVRAFDISEEMIGLAKQSCPPENAEFRVNNGTAIPCPDALADCVVAYCVFQHLPDLRTLKDYLQEMTRVAKPGAPLLFTTSQYGWRERLVLLVQAKAFLKGVLKLQPWGLHKMQWLGIRPSRTQVRELCPFPVDFVDIGAGRWLYSGRK